MKVKCIDAKDFEDKLTEGNEYEVVISKRYIDPPMYELVTEDKLDGLAFRQARFEKVEV